MAFNSVQYAILLTVVFALYRVMKRREQNLLLLAASYLFYGFWDWRFLSLLWISTIVDFVVGKRMGTSDDPVVRKRLLMTSMSVNLGILGFFKYFGFFAESAGELLAGLGLEADFATLRIVLPVGISFYTFQTMSYTIDIYRREIEPTNNLLGFAVFVAFFPQLVAGPIERAKHLLPQFLADRPRVAASELGLRPTADLHRPLQEGRDRRRACPVRAGGVRRSGYRRMDAATRGGLRVQSPDLR